MISLLKKRKMKNKWRKLFNYEGVKLFNLQSLLSNRIFRNLIQILKNFCYNSFFLIFEILSFKKSSFGSIHQIKINRVDFS